MYQVGSEKSIMYNTETRNVCTSTCMTITSSSIAVESLEIYYEGMPNSCMRDVEIEINCPGFYNPIYQGQWFGFFINTFDNEAPNYKAIENSDRNAMLDASNFTPYPISIDEFFVTPSDNTVNTYSEWTMQLNVGVPLEKECYIHLHMPLDFDFKFESLEVSGIFRARNLLDFLATNDVRIV
jgi:hypothetical protein